MRGSTVSLPTDSSSHSTRRLSPLLLLALFLSVFASFIDLALIGPLLPEIMKSAHLSASQGGLLLTVYHSAAAVSLLLAAPQADRWGRESMIILGLLVMGVGAVAFAFLNDLTMFLWARGVAGLGGALVLPNAVALASDLVSYERRGRIVSIFFGAIASVNLIGIPLGTLLAQETSWRWSYFGVGCVTLIPLILLIFFLQPAPMPQKAKKKVSFGDYFGQFGSLLSSPKILSSLLCSYFLYFSLYALLPYLGIFFTRKFDFQVKEVGGIFMIISVGGLLGTVYGGKLADRFGKKVILLWSVMIFVFTMIFFSQFSFSGLHASVIIFFVAISFSAGETSLMALLSEQAAEKRGMVLSMGGVFSALAKASGAAFSSWLLSFSGFSLIGLVCAFAGYFAFFCIHIFYREQKVQQTPSLEIHAKSA